MNYYTVVTAEDMIPCSKEEYEELAVILDGGCAGMDCEYDKETPGIYLFCEENFSIDELPDDFFDKIGSLLKKANMPYMQFGVACYGDRSVPGSAGGTAFRIDAEGDVHNPRRTWDDISVEIAETNNADTMQENEKLRLKIATLQRDNEELRQFDTGYKLTGSLKDDSVHVARKFVEFLKWYRTFEHKYKLPVSPCDRSGIGLALNDKAGRIARHIKHVVREDPKQGWQDDVFRQLIGLIIYSILGAASLGLGGFLLPLTHELENSVLQHSRRGEGSDGTP